MIIQPTRDHAPSRILLATNNEAKVLRFRELIRHILPSLATLTPEEIALPSADIEENGQTLLENASIKARAYHGITSFPILANDTGFFVEGEGFILAPKRKALEAQNRSDLNQEETAEAILSFWKDIARKYGGRIDAAWVESFVLLHPDGTLHSAESRRELILTDQEFGRPHPGIPVRALYISKTTGKPAITHTKEEELSEMRPVISALTALFKTLPN